MCRQMSRCCACFACALYSIRGPWGLTSAGRPLLDLPQRFGGTILQSFVQLPLFLPLALRSKVFWVLNITALLRRRRRNTTHPEGGSTPIILNFQQRFKEHALHTERTNTAKTPDVCLIWNRECRPDFIKLLQATAIMNNSRAWL